MPEVASKPRPVDKTHAGHQLGVPAARLGDVVERTTKLSEDLLKSLEASERAAIEALGQFVISIEESFPQEIAATSDVAKKITESGLEMADRLVHAQHDFLHHVIDSTAKSLSSRDGAKHQSE